jgi:hypothetical protein
MYAVQLLAPIALFCGTWPRRIAVIALCALQIAIALTGNYTFFNWLSIGLTFACIDDAALARIRVLPRARVDGASGADGRSRARTVLACILGALGLLGSLDRLTREPLPAPLDLVVDVGRSFHLANGYALFANMTTERDEIELEALCPEDAARAADETAWRAYVFPHKPGPLDRAPDFTAPHQPRLDWQMWFAALGDARQSPWMQPLFVRLMDAEPTVLALFESAPCGRERPRALRATRYRYHLAPLGGDSWWTRDEGAPFFGPFGNSLK